MTFASLLTPETQTATLPALPYLPTGIGDVFSDSFESFTRGRGDTAALRASVTSNEFNASNNDLIRQRFGEDFDRNISRAVLSERPDLSPDSEDWLTEATARRDRMIREGRDSDPDAWAGIRTSDEIEAIGRDAAQVAQIEAERTTAKAPPLAAFLGQLGAGAASAFVSPINLATLPLGMGAGVGILRAIAGEAALNAAIEAAQVPMTAEWQRELGFKYGLGDAAFDVATAGIGGGALTGIVRGAAPALRAATNLTRGTSMRVLDAIGNSERLPTRVRDAARYMSRTAHIDEEIPPPRGDVPPAPEQAREDLAAHREAVQEAQEALRTNREPTFPEAIAARFEGPTARAVEAPATPIRNTDTPSFQRWFKSSAASDNGTPRPLYHGTYNPDITRFDPDAAQAASRAGEVGIHFGTAEAANRRLEALDNPNRPRREGEAANVIPAYLSVQNPLRMADIGEWTPANILQEMRKDGVLTKPEVDAAWAKREGMTAADINALLKAKGYDGIVYRNFVEGDGGDSFIIFDPKQARSAVDPGTAEPATRTTAAAPPSAAEADLTIRPVNAAESLKQAALDGESRAISETLQADFARLLRDKPDMKLLVDGEQLTLRQIADSLDEDDKILTAIRTCGLG